MNTGKVNNTVAEDLFPMFATNKKRIVTANYFNIIVVLPGNEANLLNFLLKEATVFNTIRYSTKLMMKYRAYIKAIERNFNTPAYKISRQTPKPKIPLFYRINTNIHEVRNVFIKLIEKGLIFRVNKEYVINFGLSYMVQFSAPANKWIKEYELIREKDLGNGFLYIIN